MDHNHNINGPSPSLQVGAKVCCVCGLFICETKFKLVYYYCKKKKIVIII